jgi:RNA polymerase sigma-70 factor (ECF subfamily)
MDEEKFLADQFEAHRPDLLGLAFRMLGSLSEAEDAVQEAWLRLSRADAGEVESLGAWLRTVTARLCLDQLRRRKSRREEPLDPQPLQAQGHRADPAQEAQFADSVGLALMVVLQTLPPAERVVLILHDMFDLPFEEIAPIVGRSSTAARQLASRARRRVRGTPAVPDPDLRGQQQVVDAFLTASRAGDLPGLLAVLDPDVVVSADLTAIKLGASDGLHGAETVAHYFSGRAQGARSALVDGTVGIVVAPRGSLLLVVNVTVAAGKITAIEAVADPARLDQLSLAVLDL